MTNEKMLNSSEAGEFLATLLPQRNADQWGNWLSNNRDERRDADLRVPYSRFGKSISYDGDDLMKAATTLAEILSVHKVRTCVPRAAIPVVAPVAVAPVQSLRPGLEMALKVIRSMPEGVSAENAILILLSVGS